jgi:hypothetical protein
VGLVTVLRLVLKDDLGPSLVNFFDVRIIPEDLYIRISLQVVEDQSHVAKNFHYSQQGLVFERSKHTCKVHIMCPCTKKHVVLRDVCRGK